MALWKDSNNAVHDDMDGAALSLPIWPQGMVQITQAEADAILNPLPTLSQAQDSQLSLMESSYEVSNQLPITYLTTTFQADNYSAGLLAQTITMIQATATPSVTWWDSNNVGQTLTVAQLVGLGAAIFSRGQTLFAHKQTQKAAIRTATTVTQVQGIVW